MSFWPPLANYSTQSGRLVVKNILLAEFSSVPQKRSTQEGAHHGSINEADWSTA
jgi:hypothetical protein